MNSGFGAGLFVRGLVVVNETFVVVGDVGVVIVVLVVVVVVVVVVGVFEIVAETQVGNKSPHAPVSLHLSCEVPFNLKPSGHVSVT